MKQQLFCILALFSAQPLFGQIDYQATVSAQNPTTYFKFDNSVTDSVGGGLTLSVNGTGGGFSSDYWGNASSSRFFHNSSDALTGATDIFSGGNTDVNGNAAATGTGSMTMLFRSLDAGATTGQRFLFAQGSGTPTSSNNLAMFFETTTADLKLRVGNGPTTTILTGASTSPATWYYFGVTYDEARNADEVHWYLGAAGSTLNSGIINIGNVAVVGNNGSFYLGNKESLANAFRNPGDGRIDEVAVWNRELTIGEIDAQYAAITVPEPSTFALIGLGATVLLFARRKIN